jgi:uncharacterized protein (TIGR00725 family)
VNQIIGVIGGSVIDDETYQLAFKVGELIALSDSMIICGGLSGAMEAACKGAKSKGGITIGILPGANIGDANRWVDIPIATGLGHGRNMVIVNSARAFIAIDGGYGTLAEIGFALANGKKVFGLNTWKIDGVFDCASPEDAVTGALETE